MVAEFTARVFDANGAPVECVFEDLDRESAKHLSTQWSGLPALRISAISGGTVRVM